MLKSSCPSLSKSIPGISRRESRNFMANVLPRRSGVPVSVHQVPLGLPLSLRATNLTTHCFLSRSIDLLRGETIWSLRCRYRLCTLFVISNFDDVWRCEIKMHEFCIWLMRTWLTVQLWLNGSDVRSCCIARLPLVATSSKVDVWSYFEAELC